MKPRRLASDEDPSIPVLTERLPASTAARTPAVLPSAAAAPVAGTSAVRVPTDAAAGTTAAASSMTPEGSTVDARQTALVEIASWLPAAVESLAAQHVEAAIEGAVERLTEQLRITVAAAVRDSVQAALADELERLHNAAVKRLATSRGRV